MGEGASQPSDSSWLDQMTPLRYVAGAVAFVGAGLLIAADLSAGVYVLAAGLLLSALDDGLKGNGLIAIVIAGVALMLVSDNEDWTIPFYLSIAVIFLMAVPLIYRELRRPGP